MNRYLKAAIIIGVLALIFLVLSVSSALYSVSRTEADIEAIGRVEYSAESKALIDTAAAHYSALDDNLSLKERVDNYETLRAAEAEYVRLSIKELYLAIKHGESEERIALLRSEARDLFDTYFSEPDSGLISNYQDLLDAEAAAAVQTPVSGPATQQTSQSTEEIELC